MSPLDNYPIPLLTFLVVAACASLIAVLLLLWVDRFRKASRDRAAERWDPNTARCEGCDRRVNRNRLATIESERGAHKYCNRCWAEIRALRGRAS